MTSGGGDTWGGIANIYWCMIRLWVQFNDQNIHNFNFWLNLAILKPRIYLKLQNTQSLGYKFGKKSRLRRWCKFLLENHKKSWFCDTWWQHLDAAYLMQIKWGASWSLNVLCLFWQITRSQAWIFIIKNLAYTYLRQFSEFWATKVFILFSRICKGGRYPHFIFIFYSSHIRKSPPKMAFGVICFISIYDILEITLNLIQNYTTNLLKLVSTTCYINYCIAGTTICQACVLVLATSGNFCYICI
jgi:hypothetical protein